MDQDKIQILQKENESLKQKLDIIIIQIEKFRNIIKALEEKNKSLEEKIKELEHSKNLNSSNSSKPPSSDGLKKANRTQSLRKKSDKNQGGQKGHKGTTLHQTEIPDEIITIPLDRCSNCNMDLDSVVPRIKKRQEFDIIPAKIKVTEYRTEKKKCPNCKTKLSSNFPKEIKAPVQYGPLIQQISPYLNNEHLLPQRRTSEYLRQNYETSISASSISNLNKKLNSKLDTYLTEIELYLKNCSIKHLDETGFRIEGKTQWLHSLSDKLATQYRTSSKRGDVPIGVKNIVIHDNYGSYNKLETEEHGLCNIHHLRELKALKEIDQEEWAKYFYELLELLRKKKKYEYSKITKEYKEKVNKLYEKILSIGLKYHESLEELPRGLKGRKRHRKGHNMLKRLQKNKKKVLLFIEKKEVPFSNNQAERDLRMMKLKQKISGCFRSKTGSEEFSRIKTIFSTFKKQGINILEGIEKIQKGTLSLNLPSP